MKQSEILDLSVEELNSKLAEFKKQHADLRMAHAVTPLENPTQLVQIKKTVARLATEITKRELQ